MASFAMKLVRARVLGVAVLDPVTLILGALAAGAVKGVGETATTAVKDAYAGLKKLVAGRLAGRPTAEVALAEHEQDPETWKAPLGKALTEADAATDPQVIEAAEGLMALVDPPRATAGKYAVDLRGAQGVQVGDHNEQYIALPAATVSWPVVVGRAPRMAEAYLDRPAQRAAVRTALA